MDSSAGVLTAGAAVLFWPAAPAFLLIKGKDVTINRGVIFDTFTDKDHTLVTAAASNGPKAPAASAGSGSASVSIISNATGADIEIDGAYVGSTPTTLSLSAGPHQVAIRIGNAVWQRTLQVNAGSNVSVNAQLEQGQLAARRTR